MGLHLQGTAEIGLVLSDFRQRLIGAAENWARRSGLEAILVADRPRSDTVTISFFPCIEPTEFKLMFPPGGRPHLGFGCKTSTIGPGFHAAIVDLCDAIGQELGIQWLWKVGGDETGFAVHRDFVRLQHAFLDDCRKIVEKSALLSAISVNVPFAANKRDTLHVATPMGPVERVMFDAAASSPERLVDLARALYPWWTQGAGGDFVERTLRAALWLTVWREPVTATERSDLAVIRALSDRLGSTIPADLAAAVAELFSPAVRSGASAASELGGLGYRRREVGIPIGSSWWLEFHGSAIFEREDNGTTDVMTWRGETLRATSLIVKGGEGVDDTKMFGSRFVGSEEKTSNTCRYRIRAEEIDRDGGASTSAIVVASHGSKWYLLLLTMSGVPGTTRERCATIASSVEFVPPDPAPPRADA